MAVTFAGAKGVCKIFWNYTIYSSWFFVSLTPVRSGYKIFEQRQSLMLHCKAENYIFQQGSSLWWPSC